MASRWEKREARKKKEARKGLSSEEVKALDEKEIAKEKKEIAEAKLNAEVRSIHTRLFAEEYLTMFDTSFADLKQSAKNKIYKRRKEMGLDWEKNANTNKFVRDALVDGKREMLIDLMKKYGLDDESIEADAQEWLEEAAEVTEPLERATPRFASKPMYKDKVTQCAYELIYDLIYNKDKVFFEDEVIKELQKLYPSITNKKAQASFKTAYEKLTGSW